MFDPSIAEIGHKLDEMIAEINKTNDSEHKRELLREMRPLMADLDRLVFSRDGLRED